MNQVIQKIANRKEFPVFDSYLTIIQSLFDALFKSLLIHYLDRCLIHYLIRYLIHYLDRYLIH